MGRESGRLEYWREYFSSCKFEIFSVIENAILVAALDCPKVFLSKRDGIAEKLFTCGIERCRGCDRIELCEGKKEREELEKRQNGGGEKVGGDDNEDCIGEGRPVSNYSYDEAEALTEEIEEEGQTVGEVLRIKEHLTSKEYKSDSEVFDSLRRLQLMCISVEMLKATEIGKVINGLKKHSSKQIRHIARALVEEWKSMVEEWVNSTAVLAEATPESANPVVAFDEWEGLPLLPLDEGALLAPQTDTMELSQIFDGMDDDGNFRSSGVDHIKSERTHSIENNIGRMSEQEKVAPRIHEDKHPIRKMETPNLQIDQSNVPNTQDKPQHRGLVSAPQSESKPSNNHVSSPVPAQAQLRPPRPINEHRVARDAKQKIHPPRVQVQPPPHTFVTERERTEDRSVREKLELAKRKLHEGYRQAESAKRQRTIQVMELHDIPKQSLGNRQHHEKIANNRYWANRRM